MLTNTNANYSPESRSLEFEITSVEVQTADGPTTFGVVEWFAGTTKDARDFLGGENRRGADDQPEDDPRELWLFGYLTDAAEANAEVRPTDAVKAGGDEKGIVRSTVYRQMDKLKAAGLAESISVKKFPREVFWQIVGAPGPDETTGETTGADEATGDTSSDQREHPHGGAENGQNPPVVSPNPTQDPSISGSETTGDPIDSQQINVPAPAERADPVSVLVSARTRPGCPNLCRSAMGG